MADAVQRRVLAACVLGSTLGFVDVGAVGVILPVIQRDLAVGISTLQWIVGAASLFLSSLLLAGGALGDRYGRRRIFMAGVATFGAGALAAGLAPAVAWLLAARAVQGVGAALLVPGSLALIAAHIPEEKRGRAYGAWAAASGLMAAGAPFAAGYLAQTFSWRAVFFALLPIALAALVLLARVPESRAETLRRLDARGTLLATVGLGGIAFGLVEGGRLGFGPLPWTGLALGIAGMGAFVLWERRAPTPMLPPDLFARRAFRGANLATFLLYAPLSGALFFLPFHLIQLRGYTPALAGAASMPFALLFTLLSRPIGRYADEHGARGPLVVGSIVVAAGYAWFGLMPAAGTYVTTYFPAYVLLGLGMAAVVAPVTATVMASVPEGRTGIASAVNNAVSRTAGLLAVALFGLLALQVFVMALPPETEALLGPSVRDLAEAQPPETLDEDASAQARRHVEAAFLRAFRVVMGVSAGLALAAAAVCWRTIGPQMSRERKRA